MFKKFGHQGIYNKNFKEPKLLKNYINKFGIDHWDIDYIIELDGDKLCNITNYGRPITSSITDTYRNFFEKYYDDGYYTFTQRTKDDRENPKYHEQHLHYLNRLVLRVYKFY